MAICIRCTHCNVQCSRLQVCQTVCCEGSSIETPLDPGLITLRVVQLAERCSVQILTCYVSNVPSSCTCLELVNGTRTCQPRRTFHSKCVPKSRRTDHDFKCQCAGRQIGRTSASVATALPHKISFFAAQTPLMDVKILSTDCA